MCITCTKVFLEHNIINMYFKKVFNKIRHTKYISENNRNFYKLLQLYLHHSYYFNYVEYYTSILDEKKVKTR